MLALSKTAAVNALRLPHDNFEMRLVGIVKIFYTIRKIILQLDKPLIDIRILLPGTNDEYTTSINFPKSVNVNPNNFPSTQDDVFTMYINTFILSSRTH